MIIGHGLRHADPMRSTRYFRPPWLSDEFLAGFYCNALANRIVSIPADDAVKSGFTIKGDVEENAIQMLDDLGWEDKASDAMRWSRLFGGSAILMMIDDGCNLDQPVDLYNIKEVEALIVYDKREISTYSWLRNINSNDKNFGKPEFYSICSPGQNAFSVHHTRLQIFDGLPLPRRERLERGGWGLSCLQGLVDGISNNEHAHSLAIKILERLSQPVLSIEGLLDKLAADDGKDIQNYLNLIDMARSLLNTVAIDKADSFALHNIPVSGIDNLLDKFGQYVSTSANIPFSILFGRAPTGLQATGEAELEKYYGFVGQGQKRELKPNLDRLVKYLQLSKNGLFKGKELENWKIEFNPLWQPSEKEQSETAKMHAEANKTQAEADKTYFDLGVVDELQIKDRLEREGKYNFKANDDISLDEGLQDE